LTTSQDSFLFIALVGSLAVVTFAPSTWFRPSPGRRPGTRESFQVLFLMCYVFPNIPSVNTSTFFFTTAFTPFPVPFFCAGQVFGALYGCSGWSLAGFQRPPAHLPPTCGVQLSKNGLLLYSFPPPPVSFIALFWLPPRGVLVLFIAL